MFRRSPRLISNGYYRPNQQISYRENPARNFRRRNRRVGGAYLYSFSEINIRDYERLEAIPVLTHEHLRGEFMHPPTEGPPSEDPIQAAEELREDIPLGPIICTVLVYFFYICLLFTFIFALLSSVIHLGEKTNENINSLKQVIKKQTLECEELEKIIYGALRTDNTGMADYALESLGSTVITSSQTHKPRYCNQFNFSIWCKNHGPETVLQSDIFPGKCWGFKGSQGHLVIALPHPVRITHIAMEHLPKVFSPTGHIRSAPKDFAVYGIVNETKKGKLLGKFTYDQNGEPIQTFKIPDSLSEVYRLVALRILRNWGHPEYTCVYRFRVHSQPRSR